MSKILENPLEYTKYQIANTPLRQYPYDHLFVKDIFPPYFYKNIVENIPEKENYYLGKRSMTYDKRLTFDITKDKIKNLQENQQTFWNEFINYYTTNDFMNFVLSKFGDAILSRYRNRTSARILLAKDMNGYGINPHTDGGHKLISMIFYLPKDLSQREAGTNVVLPKDRTRKTLSKQHLSWSDFDNVFSAPFEPNCMFGFFVSDSSYHAVAEIEVSTPRDSLQYFISIPGEET